MRDLLPSISPALLLGDADGESRRRVNDVPIAPTRVGWALLTRSCAQHRKWS
jgi:hypothetical protein